MLRPILLGGAFAAAILAGYPAHAVSVTPVVPHGFPTRALVQLAHEGHGGGAQASGVLNAVDPAHRTVNLSHGSIKALGWPAMTMDFPASPDVDLAKLKPGMRVEFTLVRASNGMVVDSIRPAPASNQ